MKGPSLRILRRQNVPDLGLPRTQVQETWGLRRRLPETGTNPRPEGRSIPGWKKEFGLRDPTRGPESRTDSVQGVQRRHAHRRDGSPYPESKDVGSPLEETRRRLHKGPQQGPLVLTEGKEEGGKGDTPRPPPLPQHVDEEQIHTCRRILLTPGPIRLQLSFNLVQSL